MRFSKTPKLLAVALAALSPMVSPMVSSRAASAEALALLPASGVNLHEGILEAARDVLKGHLMRSARYKVIVPAGAPPRDEQDPQAAAEQGKALGADLAAVLRITRLGSGATVRLSVYNTGTGQVVHADDLQAATPDDLDAVLARLANALVTGQPARDSADIDSVTQKEADAKLKRTATRSFGVRLGTAFVLNRAGGNNGLSHAPGFGLFWLYDARQWLADVALDLHPSGDNHIFAVGIGAYYPFRRGDFTPYVGSAARWSVSEFGGASASGLALQPTGGILLGRLSTVQIRAELGFFFNLYKESSRDPDQDFIRPALQEEEPIRRRSSFGPALSFGIGF